MYGYPVFLPPQSNREDYLIPGVALNDDDAGVPLNLAGITLPGGQDFTGAAWTVTSGAIVTASNTLITIPNYPIGSQLSALALIVGVGLGILPGSPVQIADASGLNTMVGYVTSYVPATGALVCQIGSTFQFEIRHAGPHQHTSDYGPSFAAVGSGPNAAILSAKLGNGIYITDLGFIQIRIPEATFRTLRSGTYDAALTMFDGSDTRQVFISKQPVTYGGVAR